MGMGRKFVDPNPGQQYDDVPYRTLGPAAGPKILYKEGDVGQKFVQPNPGNNVDLLPYRSSSLLKADPKTILEQVEVVNKYTAAGSALQKPYRNNNLLKADPRTIHEQMEICNKYVPTNLGQKETPYRNHALATAEPKTFFEEKEVFKFITPTTEPESAAAC